MINKFIFIVLVLCNVTYSYKILSILPFYIKSHYRIFDPIMIELAQRGHNVTVLNPFPKSEKIGNYTEIDTSKCISVNRYDFVIDDISKMSSSIPAVLKELLDYLEDDKEILKCEPVQKLLKSNDTYDLLITELFISDTYLGFIKKFQIPLVAFCAHFLTPWTAERVGEIDNPSYLQVLFNNVPMHMKSTTFSERLYNVYIYTVYKFLFKFVLQKKSHKIAEQHFRQHLPALDDIARNISLVLTFSHFLTHVPRPHVPSVKEIGGIHIQPTKPLIQDVQDFIDNSPHGVIYFSMGSLLKGSSFPKEKNNAFIYAFSKVSQRILWKYEGDVLPGKPDNVKILKWMPQRDILAHPNVKLFISHGGALGINEAVYEGVPILGIPIFADQHINLAVIKDAAAGEILNYDEITNKTVFEKVQLLLTESKYRENAKKLSAIYRDYPMSPMDTAIYWIEYVIRHKGAPHLRSAAANLSWYQYLLLDVIAFLLIAGFLIVFVLYYSFKFLIRFYLFKTDKEKKN